MIQNEEKVVRIDISKKVEQTPELTFEQLVTEMFQVKDDVKEWIKTHGRTEDEKLDLYAIHVEEKTKYQTIVVMKQEYAGRVLSLFGLI